MVSTNPDQPIASGAVKLGTDAATAVQNVNWAAPSWDLIIILFFLVAVFLYGVSLGRERVIVILVTIYMSLAVVTNAPYIKDWDKQIDVGKFFAFRVLLFLGTFVILFFLAGRSALSRTFTGLAAASWWQVLLFSVFHVGLLISITLSFLPAEALNQLAPMTREVFASDNGRFFWIVAPIVAMVFAKAKDADDWRDR